MSKRLPERIPHSVAQIILATAQVFEVTVADLLSRRRPRHLATARLVAMALSFECTNYTLMQIGFYFSGRDHGTIIHAVNRFAEIKSNPHYAHLVHAVCTQLATPIKISKTSVQSSDFRAEFLKPVTSTFSGYLQPTSL